MPKAYSIYVEDMAALFAVLEGFSQVGETWIYRGQADARWPLASSLERAVTNYARQQNLHINVSEVERDIMEMGRRILKARPDTVTFIDDDLDLLAYIQHHGGITRLLDLTDSFTIALFFAVNESTSEFATVWCLNRRKVNGMPSHREVRRELAQEILAEKREINAVFSFAPLLLNERMVAQQGLFLFPCAVKRNLQGLLFDSLELGYTDKKALEFPQERDLLQKLCCLHCFANEEHSAECSQQYMLWDRQMVVDFMQRT